MNGPKLLFRNYDEAPDRISNLYRLARKNQTVEYVKRMHKLHLNHVETTNIFDALRLLNDFNDMSDPDVNIPNLNHLLQTAEAIKSQRLPEWMQIVGLIHDLGKILFKNGCDEDGTSYNTQWGVVGDTFLVGEKLPSTIVYPEFNKYNDDIELNYSSGCGLENCLSSFGHDEYIYSIMKLQNLYNKKALPDEGLYMLKYHSMYVWHTHNEYTHLMNRKDWEMLESVKKFNSFDLYTKVDAEYDFEKLMPYYKKIYKDMYGTLNIII